MAQQQHELLVDDVAIVLARNEDVDDLPLGAEATSFIPSSHNTPQFNNSDQKPAALINSALGPSFVFFVNEFPVNMTMDTKLDEAYPEATRGRIPRAKWANFIDEINLDLKKVRAKTLDHMLLFSGTAMLPLIPWFVRKAKRDKKVKVILKDACRQFNQQFAAESGLEMRFDRRGAEGRRLVLGLPLPP
jgi:hypothetical protein